MRGLWTVVIGFLMAGAVRAEPAPFIEVELAPEAPYVQQQVTYTARLFRTASLQQGKLLAPRAEGVVVRELGPPSDYSLSRDGRRYRVREQRYALFPQRSGTVAVEGPVFSGRELFARGPKRRLTVKPAPPEAGGRWWLPAEEVRLDGSLSVPERAVTGEPVIRTVTLSARGLGAAQLPELMPSGDAHVQRYREYAERDERVEEGRVVGSLTERWAVIPRRPGVLELPPVTVRWWDTRDGRLRTASLPGRTVRVTGEPLEVPAAGAHAPEADVPARPTAAEVPARSDRQGPVGLVAAALYASAVLAVLLVAVPRAAVLWRRGSGRMAARRDLRRKRRAAVRACRRGDPKEAKDALLSWGAALCPTASPKNLPALARLLGSEAVVPLQTLDRALYGAGATWDRAGCLRAVRSQRRRPRRDRPGADALPPLRLEEGR